MLQEVKVVVDSAVKELGLNASANLFSPRIP